MTAWELDDYAARYRLPRETLRHIPFYDFDDRVPPGSRSAAGRSTTCLPAEETGVTGRPCFARTQTGLLGCGVTTSDRPVERWAAAGVQIWHDIPREQHDALLADAAAVPPARADTAHSCGHVRLMSATTWGVPVVATQVRGLRGYEHLVTRAVPPGDRAALSAALC